MTNYRISLTNRASGQHIDRTLQWDADGLGSRIDWGTDFFQGWRPTRPAADLFALAASVYCIDKLTSREETDDAWTRSIEVHNPVDDYPAWSQSRLSQVLGFLTGDDWNISPYRNSANPLKTLPSLPEPLVPIVDIDAVSLFSGGLDSLCGVIDVLESQPNIRLGLVSHYESGQVSPRQIEIHARLAEVYGAERVVLRRIWLRPAPRADGGEFDVVETSTRARSFLFIAAALALASSAGGNVPVFVPENGYIALNVPLTRARVGSYSTRTTHPHYLKMYGEEATALGIANPIRNPHQFSTKGEMLVGSRNPELLRELAPRTISCSHPEVGRWGSVSQGNCGYCFPCLIRRASLHAAGLDNEAYAWDVLSDAELLHDTEKHRGADLRALINGIYSERNETTLLRNAPLPGDRRAYLDTWRRGNTELRTWLEYGATGELARLVERLR